MRHPTPPAEVDIDATLVRALLTEQHPDLADLPLTAAGSGWDNALFRLGRSLAVRLPRRAAAASLIANEQRWLPELAPLLPLPVPVVQRIGAPGCGYPWSWSVIPWLSGASATDSPPRDEDEAARTLAGFIEALHSATPPPDAPANRYRGVPLAERTTRVHEHVRELDGIIDRDQVLSRWDALVAAEPWAGPPVWLHGDLHPGNLLVSEGALAGVLDFGDLTTGDPANDLSVAWMLLKPRARTVFREAFTRPVTRMDDALWTRAQGWALALGLAWLVHSAEDEVLERECLTAINAVLAEGR